MNWSVIAITFVGGLSLFLYGMNLMSEGMNKSAGKTIRNLLHLFTKNRFSAILTGSFTTMLVQSSSAVSVMIISLVRGKILPFNKTIGLLLGAGIGTTITAQIIAFHISDYALLIVAIGFFIGILSKRHGFKMMGAAMLGLGLLFYGLHLMSEAMHPLREYDKFLNVLTQLENPITGIIVGFVFTAIIQSSSAFIGIIIVLASQQLLNLESGVALLLGSNIGTTVTAIIASFNANTESKRVALAFFIIKVLGVAIVCWWIPSFIELVHKLSGSAGQAELPRLIANAHTLFNIFVTVLILPFTNSFAKVITRIIPEKQKTKDQPISLQYINNELLATPGIAVSMAKKEIIEMAVLVKDMLMAVLDVFTTKKQENILEIQTTEEKIDFLRQNIAIYLTRISQQNLPSSLVNESFTLLYINAELEEIGDVISNTLLKKGKEWITSDKQFSQEGLNEIIDYHSLAVSQLCIAIQLIDSLDTSLAKNIKKEHKRIRNMAEELKRNHYERLSLNVTESLKTSKLHMELIGALRIIHSHIANIARIISGKKNNKK